jgi:YD repeat-containing protein
MAHKRTSKRTASRSSTTTPGTAKTKQTYTKAGKPSTKTVTATPTTRQSYVTYNESETSRPTVPTTVIGVAGTAKDVVTPNQSPMPQGKGELVFALGFGLILLSGFTSKNIQAVLDLFTNAKNMKYSRQQARVGMVVLTGELIFLMVLTEISESSEDFSNVALALIFGLFLVWGIQNVGTSSKWVEFITGGSKKI